MPRKRGTKAGQDLPDIKWIYRYWVELRDLRDESRRTLPLSALTMIHIPRRKNDPRKPDKHVLRLQDEAIFIEARDIDDFAVQLREKYPDKKYERVLHRARDLGAEQCKEEAVRMLVAIIAKAALDELLLDQDGQSA